LPGRKPKANFESLKQLVEKEKNRKFIPSEGFNTSLETNLICLVTMPKALIF
jgi:hypothetical protein